MKTANAKRREASGRVIYPFTAIVGQEQLLLALLLNAINPSLSGVLVRGEKGTAKSTAVRALADLLPDVEVVADCPFGCHPRDKGRMCLSCRERLSGRAELKTEQRKVQVINLPIGATEDRVVGSIDFEHALREGQKRIETGILASANRNILYVDEVNLLDDHIVDLLLDTAVTGINIIEREGISFAHPAEFALVGTMNPEEGELRPQLLDRFGLCVSIESIPDAESRVMVIKRREEFDSDPPGFSQKWARRQESLRTRIRRARELLPRTFIPEKTRAFIAQICLLNQVDGHRADIYIEKTAKTIAAFNHRLVPTLEDLSQAAALVLPHRSRRTDLPKKTLEDFHRMLAEELAREEGHSSERQRSDDEDSSPVQVDADQMVTDEDSEFEEGDGASSSKATGDTSDLNAPDSAARLEPGTDSEMLGNQGEVDGQRCRDRLFGVGETFRVPPLLLDRDRNVRKKSGRRMPTKTLRKTGRYVRSTAERRNDDLAFDATIRAAAPHQKNRVRRDVAIAIEESDIREKVREMKAGSLMLFVVDASGSMGTRLMTETKAAMISLLLDAYQKRDKVALVTFKGDSAEVLLPPTNSIDLAKKLLEDLPAGGKTPLGHGLLKAHELLINHLRRDSQTTPLMVLISDGEANVGIRHDRTYEGPGYSALLDELFEIAKMIREDKRIKTLVIDTEEKRFSVFRNASTSPSMAQRVARSMGASYCKIEDFRAGGLVRAVKEQVH
ncbi:MAG: VWA domain-containing protein [Candidatus Abyssobacteria bacterium SURF_17]|uniref:VWA domain-containing protein n=1 Tax=Candidatus Abyssobacteria bacterium SURF_17 TaxID=2093361 RepID=A0A419ETT0_9BACT|nr:MAG: VWA domain-containing protein [Candidatus Abyssubacteria bacterium SURF_17]